jgi:hypothetical protein
MCYNAEDKNVTTMRLSTVDVFMCHVLLKQLNTLTTTYFESE